MKAPRVHPLFGDIFYAELLGDEHIQSGIRPVVIAQNNVGNCYSPTVEVIPMTSRINKAKYMPTHVLIRPDETNGLRTPSIILAEQVVTIQKKRLLDFVGIVDHGTLSKIGEARKIQSPFLSSP